MKKRFQLSREVKPMSKWLKIPALLLMTVFLYLGILGMEGVIEIINEEGVGEIRGNPGYREDLNHILITLTFLMASYFLGYRLFVPLKKQVNMAIRLNLFVGVSVLIIAYYALIFEVRYCCGGGLNSEAKSNLHNLYLGCQAFWAEQGGDKNCSIDIVSQAEYGFVKSPHVHISAKGDKRTFKATAIHEDSTTFFHMDAKGNIR